MPKTEWHAPDFDDGETFDDIRIGLGYKRPNVLIRIEGPRSKTVRLAFANPVLEIGLSDLKEVISGLQEAREYLEMQQH